MNNLMIIIGILFITLSARVLMYLESGRAETDPIAGIKEKVYLKDLDETQVMNFKPDSQGFSLESTRPMPIRVLWGLGFGGVPLLMFIMVLLGDSSTRTPGSEIIGLFYITIFTLPLTLFGIMFLIPDLQKMRGALQYSLTNNALVVRNILGNTVIPFSLIENVKKDALIIEERKVRRGRANLVIYSYQDSVGSEAMLYRKSWLPQYNGAPYVSKDAGDCVFLSVRGCNQLIAVTPEDMGFHQELLKRLSIHAHA